MYEQMGQSWCSIFLRIPSYCLGVGLRGESPWLRIQLRLNPACPKNRRDVSAQPLSPGYTTIWALL